jgi:hypothetical protein
MIDQIAFKVLSIDASILNDYQRMGIETPWVRDQVFAVNLYRNWSEGSAISAFEVKLAFNYSVIEGVEYELIELVRGRTCQFDSKAKSASPQGTLSHLGYHVADYADNPASLMNALEFWKRKHFKILQVAQTVSHSGTDKRYRYAFVDTTWLFGAPVKIIQRYTGDPAPPCEPIDHFMFDKISEEFKWLEK